MSFLVTRPPAPVPGTREGSTPCSSAIFRTTGETKARGSPGAAAAGAGAAGGGAGAAAGLAGAGSGALAAAGSGGETAAPASVSITPTTWFTGTVSPSR